MEWEGIPHPVTVKACPPWMRQLPMPTNLRIVPLALLSSPSEWMEWEWTTAIAHQPTDPTAPWTRRTDNAPPPHPLAAISHHHPTLNLEDHPPTVSSDSPSRNQWESSLNQWKTLTIPPSSAESESVTCPGRERRLSRVCSRWGMNYSVWTIRPWAVWRLMRLWISSLMPMRRVWICYFVGLKRLLIELGRLIRPRIVQSSGTRMWRMRRRKMPMKRLWMRIVLVGRGLLLERRANGMRKHRSTLPMTRFILNRLRYTQKIRGSKRGGREIDGVDTSPSLFWIC